MADPQVNFFKSQLIGEYSNVATSFTISTGDGALLPDPSVDGEYNLVIFEGTAGSSADEFEVVRVTAKSSDTLTVTRGQEGTTPITVTSAFHSIIMAATKKIFDDIRSDIDNIDLTTISGAESITFDSTGDEEFGLPAGTTAQRPASPSAGYMRYNTETAKLEVYSGGVWGLVSLENVRAMGVAQATVTANDAVFLPPLEVEYLVIAGGGGGGGSASGSALGGGGGGAGGYRSSVVGESSGGGASAESTLSLTRSTNYTVTVGAGGAFTDEDDTGRGNPGSNSVFSTITSIGGGGGGTRNGTESGGDGGSGGGACGNSTELGGSGTANQGFDGGDSTGGSSDFGAGGGGGAGASASNTSTSTSTAGGVGVSSSITGSAVFRAGGGGGGGNDTNTAGGSGGTGGGGAGGNNLNDGVDGTTNTGGGGGGAGSTGLGTANTDSGAGGSGVVILRYPSAYSISVGAGLTGSETTVGANKVATITAGTGNVSWS